MSHPYSDRRIRASLGAFALGKAISAPMTLALVLVLALVMDRAEYARYVASVAVLEIAVVLGTLGVEWVMQTAVAGVLVHGNAAQLRRVVRVLATVPCVAYAILAAGLWLAAPWVAAALGTVASVELLRLYAWVLALEGPLRMLRDSLMAVMMLQRTAQVATVLRVLVMFGAVGVGWATQETVSATWVAGAELLAAGCSLAVVLATLAWHLHRQRPRTPLTVDISPWLGWHSIRFAGHAYASLLLMLMVGTDVMIALVARYLGVELTAAFGFLVRLYETIKRYLPMDLFWGVFRPATMGRYESQGRHFAVLMRDANRMIEANLFTIGLVLAVAVAGGEALVHALTRGQGALPVGLLWVMLPLLATHTIRRTLELIAYVRGASIEFVRAARIGLLAPCGVAAALAWSGQVYAAPLTVLLIDACLIADAVRRLRAHGQPVAFHGWRWQRLAWATAGAAASGALLHALWPGAWGAGVAVAWSGAAFTMSVWALHIFADDDWSWLRGVWRGRGAARSA